RELGSADQLGRSITGIDTTGTMTTRPRDAGQFMSTLAKVTGVAANEVYGFFNQSTIPLEIQIVDPKNPATVLKTLYIADAQFQPPGTPARVNQPTDFAFTFTSLSGT